MEPRDGPIALSYFLEQRTQVLKESYTLLVDFTDPI